MHKAVVELIQRFNSVAKMALENPAEAIRQLDDPEFQHEDFVWLRACILFEASRNLMVEPGLKQKPAFTEFDVHRSFWSRLNELVPGATRAEGPASDGVNIPDGWVLLDGEVIPVEMKRDVFNGAARNQLKRYMTAYGARRGIAVCPAFRCETDPSIMRIVCRPALPLH